MQSKFQIKSIGIDLGKTTFHLIALGTRAQVHMTRDFYGLAGDSPSRAIVQVSPEHIMSALTQEEA